MVYLISINYNKLLSVDLAFCESYTCIDITLIINGPFIVARAFYAHVLCPRLDKMCMKIHANRRYKDKSAQTVVCQSKHSS